MPTVIGIRCVESGYLPAKVGRFTLSRSGLDTVPLRRGMPLESRLPNGQRTRLPNTEIIYSMSGAVSPKTKAVPGAVMVSSCQLPLDLLAPFTIAQEPFLTDITRFCDALVFMPFLHYDQQSSAGFIGQGKDIARALDRDDPGRTMFVNLFNAQGGRFEPEAMYWTISPLLAEMKMNQLLRLLGVAEASPSLTEYYRSRYQGNMLNRIIGALLTCDPAYPGSQLQDFHRLEFISREKIANNALRHLDLAEMKIVSALE